MFEEHRQVFLNLIDEIIEGRVLVSFAPPCEGCTSTDTFSTFRLKKNGHSTIWFRCIKDASNEPIYVFVTEGKNTHDFCSFRDEDSVLADLFETCKDAIFESKSVRAEQKNKIQQIGELISERD